MAEVKIPNNLLDLERVRLLEWYKHRDTMLITWLKLIMKSRRIKNRRFIWRVADTVKLTDEVLSHLLRVDNEVCLTVFNTLQELGFVERKPTYIEVFRIWENEQRNRSTPEYKHWRESVFKRDNYTCQSCNARGVELNAHHVIRWADSKKERFNIHNGITLCRPCHIQTHRRSD